MQSPFQNPLSPDIQFTAQSYTFSQQQPPLYLPPQMPLQQHAQQHTQQQHAYIPQKPSTVYSQPIIPNVQMQEQILKSHIPDYTQTPQNVGNYTNNVNYAPGVPTHVPKQFPPSQTPDDAPGLDQSSSLVQVPPQVIRKLEKPQHLMDPTSEDPKQINRSVFKSSFWDQAPFKRNNQERNQIIQVDYFFNADVAEQELPPGYAWTEFDPENDHDVETMTDFLNKHYQKYDKEYKPTYIKWLLTPPTYQQYKRLENVPKATWFIGVKSEKNGILVGLITARPVIYQIDEKYIQTFTVDFLCTHKQLRGKHLAPVLVKEMYRRLGTFQYDIGAYFVANAHLPFNSTVKTSQILFRPLTMEKISKTLFSSVPPDQLARLRVKYENIQPTNDLQLIRFANTEDVPMMMNIYEEYCQKYRLSHTMNREEFEHYFLPNNEMIFTYVITNAQGEIKDFISLHAFWTRRGEKNAYLYYVSFINEMLLELLMRNILFIMKSNGFDMIFANDVMGISKVFSERLDFKSLDEICNYYIFNYNTQTMEKNECGLNRVF